MKHLFFIHWNEAELKELIAPLKKAGYTVSYHFSTESLAAIRDKLPDVLVISLDRLPSHGKAYAEWFWEAKKRQHIPIIFCGGKTEKVEPVKTKFPNARFCSHEDLLTVLPELRSSH